MTENKGGKKIIELKGGNKSRKKLIYAIALAVLAAIGIACFVFTDGTLLDSAGRIVRYFSAARKNDGTISEITISASSKNSYGDLGGCFIVGDAGGIELYSQNGELVFTQPIIMTTPVVKTGDEIGIVYDLGGKTLTAFDQMIVIKTIETDYPIIDASISGNWVSLTTEENSYKAVTTVYDVSMAERYKFYSAERYLLRAAAAPDGHCVTAAAMSVKDAKFTTKLLTYRLDSEEIYSTFEINDKAVLAMEYVSNSQLCVLCEDELLFINEDGTKVSYDFSNKYLSDFAISDDGYAALALGDNRVDSRGTVITFSSDGTVLGSIDCNEELLCLTAKGGYVGVLTAGQLNIYTSAMQPKLTIKDLSGAQKAIIRDDATAFIIYSDRAKLYIP